MIISLRVNLMKIRNLTLLKILIKYLQVKTVYIQSKFQIFKSMIIKCMSQLIKNLINMILFLLQNLRLIDINFVLYSGVLFLVCSVLSLF